jgi:hypothetical protein
MQERQGFGRRPGRHQPSRRSRIDKYGPHGPTVGGQIYVCIILCLIEAGPGGTNNRESSAAVAIRGDLFPLPRLGIRCSARGLSKDKDK